MLNIIMFESLVIRVYAIRSLYFTRLTYANEYPNVFTVYNLLGFALVILLMFKSSHDKRFIELKTLI